MGFLFQRSVGFGRGVICAVAVAGLSCGVVGAAVPANAWDAAVKARERFEAEPAGTHTKAEYAQVMDGFRVIYHADPGAAHAARAVEQVAELLAEQGRELGEKKSLHDAAGQYEFLAKAYPGGTLAEHALQAAVALLGADGADDPVELKRVRAELVERYPRAVEVPAAQKSLVYQPTQAVSVPTSQNRDKGHPVVMAAQEQAAAEVLPEKLERAKGPVAMVTGIRHWSTPTYTRVAIDLEVQGDDDSVRYEAARVENPDRIFFDLHHARLAPPLVGKSFSVTDDGFLTRVRAAQSADDVTRVVLDVHAVAEYSAFLLPNPTRLIIDIHGRPEVAGKKAEPVAEPVVAAQIPAVVASTPVVPTSQNRDVGHPFVVEVPTSQNREIGHPHARLGVETSSLPPMPVTDGSAGFGLPAKTESGKTVAAPRVVISSKPTAAKPVPNTVTKASSETGSEVAAVSLQPGKVEATSHPTAHPITSGGAASGDGEHYRKPVHAAVAVSAPAKDVSAPVVVARAPVVPTSQNRDVPPQRASALAGDPGVPPQRASALAGDPGVPPQRASALAGDPGVPPQRASALAGDPGVGHPAVSVATAAGPVVAAPPTADGETLVRALGLKIGRIVIDAGHGGHDSGTLGAGGIEEKDVVLDVALRLGKLLHDRLGAEIVYTRADDTFIPLETRTAIANKAQADLFISVHANSSQDPSARGVEVYYLNFTSDPEAMKVASRENAVSTQSVHELSDLVKKIALKDKIDESKELATDVDASLFAGLTKGNAGLRDRGVKKAPFVVLIGANMPSILAEISFVTNPDDADQLERPEYRQRVAESLYGGVARYAKGINGAPAVRVAGAKTKATERAAVK